MVLNTVEAVDQNLLRETFSDFCENAFRYSWRAIRVHNLGTVEIGVDDDDDSLEGYDVSRHRWRDATVYWAIAEDINIRRINICWSGKRVCISLNAKTLNYSLRGTAEAIVEARLIGLLSEGDC